MFNSRSSSRIIVMLVLVGIVLAVLNKQPLGAHTSLLISPVLEVIQKPRIWWEELQLWFEKRQALQRENTQLRAHVEQNAALSQHIAYLEQETTQLKILLNLLNIKNDSFIQWSAARIIGRSPDKKSQRLILQFPHGRADDVVISGSGLVGLVELADASFLTVRTIMDASIAVPATMPGLTSLAALVRGEGSKLRIDMIPQSANIHVGDTLYTSGSGGIYPPGIPIAIITQIKHPKGEVFAEVFATPASFWHNDRWLMVASKHLAP